MKSLKCIVLFVIIALISSASINAQNPVRSTVYINPGINMPSHNFGYPVNAKNASLNTLGAGFGAGVIFYFSENNDADIGSLFNLGLDFTVGEFLVNSNVIVAPNHHADYIFSLSPEDPELTSRMLAMKLGPVLTIVPKSKFGIDIYAQGMLGISNFEFYNTERGRIDSSPTMTPQYRVAGGIRIGYHVLFLNIEYSWGEPVVRKPSLTEGEISTFKIDQSFLRIGLTSKFSAFRD